MEKIFKRLSYFIIYLIIGFVPHIYRYVEFSPAKSESVFFKNATYVDLYMLAKGRIFICLTVILTIIFLYQLSQKHYKLIKDKVMTATMLMAVIVLLSSFVSVYGDIVYRGAKDRFEGMWVWLCYLLFFTIVRHYAKDRRFIKNILKVFSISAAIMAIFGLMQVTGYDIYTEGVLRWLAFPKEMASNMADYMVSNVTEAGAVGALFNSNYFGAYIGLSALLSLYFVFAEDKKNIFYIVLFALQYGALIASRSEAGLLGFSVAIFLFVIAYGKLMTQKKIYLGLVIVLGMIIDRVIAANLLYGQSGNVFWVYLLMITAFTTAGIFYWIFNKKPNLVKKISHYSLPLSVCIVVIIVVGIYIAVGLTGHAGSANDISTVTFNKNILVIGHDNQETFAIECLETGINAYDKKLTNLTPEILGENRLAYAVGNKRYVLEVRNYENGILLGFEAPMSLNIFYDGATMQYVNPVSGFATIDVPERITYLYEHGSAFTNRAYIWSTYLPEAQKHFLLGKGVDTYLLGYPQNDYFGKTSFYAAGDTILIDKPHSMYLDVLFGTGIIGVLLLLGFVMVILSRYWYGILLSDGNVYLIMLIGSIMILVTGIFNDSVIPMTMLLSCFAGMGLMVNGEEN